jgi:hypothetical protein
MPAQKSKARSIVTIHEQGSLANPPATSLEEPKANPQPHPVNCEQVWAGCFIEFRVPGASAAQEAHTPEAKPSLTSGTGNADVVTPAGVELSEAGSKPPVPTHFSRIWAGCPIDVPVSDEPNPPHQEL